MAFYMKFSIYTIIRTPPFGGRLGNQALRGCPLRSNHRKKLEMNQATFTFFLTLWVYK